jgi:anti-sigma factor ChrR (cupin superfamily)
MESDDLAELATLYALQVLDEAELVWVDEQYSHSPAWQAEVADLESTVAMLAYGAAPIAMAPDLKDRLFERIAVEDALKSATTAPTDAAITDTTTIAENPTPASDNPAELLQQAKQATWQPYSYGQGVQIATLRVDDKTRRVECFVRSFGQTKFPQHRHANSEEILVLEGDLTIGSQVYLKGDRVHSLPGTVHQPETLEGCTLFLRTSLDDEILL